MHPASVCVFLLVSLLGCWAVTAYVCLCVCRYQASVHHCNCVSTDRTREPVHWPGPTHHLFTEKCNCIVWVNNLFYGNYFQHYIVRKDYMHYFSPKSVHQVYLVMTKVWWKHLSEKMMPSLSVWSSTANGLLQILPVVSRTSSTPFHHFSTPLPPCSEADNRAGSGFLNLVFKL